MNQTKVYKVIECLSVDQRSKLQKFVASPYFNQSADQINLLDAINLCISGSVYMTKEEVWAHLGRIDDYNDTRFRKYCSDLLKLVTHFLAQQAFDERPLTSASYLLRYVAENRLEPLYNSALRTAQRLVENEKERGNNYLLELFRIEQFYQVIIEAENRTNRLNVEKIVDNLDKFYFAQKLTSYMTAMSQKRIINQDYNLLFIDQILTQLENQPSDEYPQLAILYLIAKIYKTNDRNYFPELKAKLVGHIHEFPAAEANEILRSTLNFLIGWLNAGDRNMLSELFDLYEYALGQPFFFLDRGFNPFIFKSIVTVSLRLEKFEWCEQFIEKYAPYLDEDDRENAVRFNLSRVRFYEKRFEDVIELLSKVEFDDITYNLSAKAILLATYYESDALEALWSFLDSFAAFLRRNTANIPELRRENYMKFIRYTRHLSRLNPYDKEKLKSLQSEVKDQEDLIDRRWLLEQIQLKIDQ